MCSTQLTGAQKELRMLTMNPDQSFTDLDHSNLHPPFNQMATVLEAAGIGQGHHI